MLPLVVLARIVVTTTTVTAPAPAAQPAVAAEPSAAAASQPAQAPAHAVSPLVVTPSRKTADLDPDQVVCHEEIPMGSLLPKKVCASRRAFDQRHQTERQVLEDWQRSPINSSR